MKKLVIVLASVLAGVSVYAQGTVVFQNASPNFVTNGLTGAKATTANSTFQVALFCAPDGATAPAADSATWVQIGLPVFLSPLAGQFSGGTRTLQNVPEGSQAWIMVRGWEAAFGGDYNTALTAPAMDRAGTVRQALVGTAIFKNPTGAPTASPPISAPTLTGFPGMILTPVPEPSVIGLGLLGIGALALLRRRNS